VTDLLQTPVEFDPFASGELDRTAPATEEQEEIWAAVQVGGEPANLAYNESVSLRMKGRLDRSALERALGRVLERHEALRATFTADGSTLCIAAQASVAFASEDLSNLPDAALQDRILAARRQAVTTPFDLTRGPLLRAELLRLEAELHELVVTAHHIVCDGWSTGVVLPELGALYSEEATGRAAALPEPAKFSDYVLSQRERAGTAEAAEDDAYWLEQYAGEVPLLELPTDRPRPADRSFEAARTDHRLSPALVRGLRQVAKTAGTSLVATLLASFEVFLMRITGQRAFAVGMPAAGQATAGELGLVGHCVHTLPIRAELDPEHSFVEHLQRVKARLLDAFDHQQFTFGTLLKRLSLPRDASRVPLIPVLFNLDKSIEGLSFAGLEVDYVSNPRAYESFELFVNATQSGDDIVLETTYNENLFDAATVGMRLRELDTLLESIVRDPARKLGDLALLPDAERQKLAEWNRTEMPRPAAQTVAALVQAQVEKAPDAPAVSDESTTLSYRELDARSNRLARQLQALGVRPDDRVGICLDRSVDLVVAVLAVLKASASYVPLDPDFPAARLAFIAEDARLTAIIAESAVEESLPRVEAPVLWLDRDASALAEQSADAIVRRDEPSRLAYVLHTSGSTGKPKGVEVPNDAVVNFLVSMAREPGLTADDVLVAVTTLSFDIAGLELLLPLSVGARVVIVSRDVAVDGSKLCAVLERYGATVMQATPSTWRVLLEAGFRGARNFRALVGGEAFPPDLAQLLLERAGEVWNMYGPTETTIWSTCKRILDAAGPISIGRPIANTRLYVLDERQKLVPIGVPGELYIGGAGVARGYRDRPELTAERFVANPFEPGGRLYRTGDLVRWTPDGELVFLRRVDSQVKLRGYRVELGEIETVLGSDARVRECAAVVREDRPGDQRLVAYVAADPAARPEIGELRARLEQALPGYMVPGHIVLVDALPRTPNQKLDRRALPAPDAADASSEYAAPRTDVEQTLARHWAKLLGLPRVGVNDDFFALGGHSMLAIRMLARVRDELGVDIGLRRLFRAPSVAGLAEHVEAVHLARGARHAAGASAGEREEVVL